VISYFYFIVSAILLLMSFTDPKTEWSVNGADVYGSLFVFCAVLYIPLMACAFYYFVKAVVVVFRSKHLQGGFHPLVVTAVGVVALYSFNHWVFSEIY
jgi:hypothetical protein